MKFFCPQTRSQREKEFFNRPGGSKRRVSFELYDLMGREWGASDWSFHLLGALLFQAARLCAMSSMRIKSKNHRASRIHIYIEMCALRTMKTSRWIGNIKKENSFSCVCVYSRAAPGFRRANAHFIGLLQGRAIAQSGVRFFFFFQKAPLCRVIGVFLFDCIEPRSTAWRFLITMA